MGLNIANKLLDGGHEVVVWNRSQEVVDKLRNDKSKHILDGTLVITRTYEELRTSLRKPRVFWLMLPAGETTATVLNHIKDEAIESGDIVIDGANSFYQDTEERARHFEEKGVKYLGIGVSGGLRGVDNGYPLMVGGNQEAYTYIKAILDTLAKPYGMHTYFGPGGAGHYVKMVHNGIEYGMMQALAEGLGVLAKSNYKFNLFEVTRNWQSGSIIASYLLDMAYSALAKDPTLSQADGYVNATGEAEWTIAQGKELNVPIKIIEESLEFRKKSQFDKTTQETFAAKMLTSLRHEFGGHDLKRPEEETIK